MTKPVTKAVFRSASLDAGHHAEAPRLRTVTFGDVTVTGPEPPEAEVRKNAAKSSAALAQLAARLIRPGIELDPRKDVPLFWVDDDHPDKFVRQLNGKRELGVLENGEFRVTH